MTGETSSSATQNVVDQTAPGRLVLALGDSGAVLERVGGKGASLARLVAAGLPVPAGFHVTTACYDAFVAQGRLKDEILVAASAVSVVSGLSGDDAAGCAQAADAIARLIGGQPMPAAVSDAIVEAYQVLSGGQRPVAVRSSATAEDLPDLSFAGQQDSYLNVRGEADVLDAVKRCWASLWTARAIGYRSRNSVAADTVSLAVVVQELVRADAAGVMFTRDPVSGDADRVVINAAWGLGDAVVGGRVTPDTVVVDKRSGDVLSSDVTEKVVRTVPDLSGTRDEPVPLDQRRRAVLDAGEAAELARLGVQIEALYGYAVDIEWAREDGRFWILQARPITTRGHDDNLDPWNDSLTLDALWTRGNIGEAVPDVVTPCSRSLLDILFHDMMPTLYLGGYPPVGYLGGRLYLNLSLLMTMLAAAGQSRRRLFEATGDLFGHVPDDVQIPLLPVPRWTVLRTVLPATVRNRRRIRRNVGRLDAYLEKAPERTERLLDQIRAASGNAELADIWRRDLLPLLHESSYMLEAASKRDGSAFIRIRRTLRRLVGEDDANALLLAADEGDQQLASLGPVQGLDQLMRGDIDQAEFTRRYGHHSAHLFEVSAPRPGEDPGWIDAQIAALRSADVDIAALLAEQRTLRQAAWGRFQCRYPRRADAMQKRLSRARASTKLREAARSEQARVFWPLRAFVLRAGELTGRGEDLFQLSIDEVLRLLGGDESVLDAVPERREAYSRYCALPSYPPIIRGRFDPFGWAADPQRRSDVFAPDGDRPAPADAIAGFPGSPGVVEGPARVALSVEDGERLQPGEILVTTLTNVGWTPLFPRAGGIVTDVGAPLSHAAIVARELGIPAVVGCGDATTRVHDGDWLHLDGTAGTVEILRRSVPA